MYYIFSASKVITCNAALRFMDDGKINIDDPVSKYLPEFAELYLLKDGVKTLAKNPLTIRHFFSMQGGLTYDLGNLEIKKLKDSTNNQATIINLLCTACFRRSILITIYFQRSSFDSQFCI